MAQAGPTAYEDLNGVLEELVSGARTVLGDDLCGVYLQGSFALGDAHGLVLAGPEPKGLIDPVSTPDLHEDVLVALDDWIEWLEDHAPSRRALGVLVLTLCRMLQTLAEGRVTSKREAGEWALQSLGPEWTPLVRRAIDDRPDPWTKVREAADPEALEQTLAFLDYVRNEARQTAGTRRV